MRDHLVQHIHREHLCHDSTLHVVGVISNPARYQSRYRIFREWMKHMELTANVKLHIVEAAYGDRCHEVTKADCASHLQVRSKTEIWNKENLINLGVRYLLPKNWKYMAWVDGDVFFADPNWALETIHELQHFAIVQPWQTCLDLGPRGHGMSLARSFGWLHQLEVPKAPKHPGGNYYQYAHTGYAWACRRDFYENVIGLMDFPILGSGDFHMAWAMIGEVDKTWNPKISESYKRRCLEWQVGALKTTFGEVGFTHGRIEHWFHGPKRRRFYKERVQILLENNYDPDQDLIYDDWGLLHLVNKPKLEQGIRKYNRSRCEDSIEET